MTFIAVTCFPQKGKWDKALKINTIESYQEFLSKYPQSEYSSLAKSKIIDFEYEEIKSQNTINSLEAFLTKYPESKYTEEAEKTLKEMKFERNERELVKSVLLEGVGNKYVISDIKAIVNSPEGCLSIIQIKRPDVLEIRFISEYPNDIGISTIYQEKLLPSGGKSYSFYQLNLKTGRTSMNASTNQTPQLPKLPLGNGSLHRYKTTVYLEDIGLSSSIVSKIEVIGYNPVAFLVTEEGYVHLYGNGKVILKNGESIMISE
jgi:hypothetical protein